MESQGSIGGLIPLWILGAPFLLALFELFTTPKPSRHHRAHEEDRVPRTSYPPDTGTASRMPAPDRR